MANNEGMPNNRMTKQPRHHHSEPFGFAQDRLREESLIVFVWAVTELQMRKRHFFVSRFWFRHFFVIRHSSFVIRISSLLWSARTCPRFESGLAAAGSPHSKVTYARSRCRQTAST